MQALLEELSSLSLTCVIETRMWVVMDVPVEVQIKLTNCHMKHVHSIHVGGTSAFFLCRHM